MRTITTAKELGTALKNHEDEIYVEGDLAKATFAIHATGKAAWIVAAGCLAVAIGAGIAILIPDPAEPLEIAAEAMGLGGAITAFTIPAIAAGIGPATVAVTAVSIGVAGGGIGVLTSLRGYRLTKMTNAVKLSRR